MKSNSTAKKPGYGHSQWCERTYHRKHWYSKPSDRFVSPYANDQEARISNNGSYPPDLSVIVKARKNGADYLYNLLLGYGEPPQDFELSEGMYYNKWYEGHQISMAQPLDDEYVDYDDGTDNSLPQLAEDVVTYLAWSA